MFILGKDNKQEINNINISINNEVNMLYKCLLEYDKKINERFNSSIIQSKFKDTTQKFESSKILLSLLKIGVPIESAFSIVIEALNTIIESINDNTISDNFSTHDIRKIVYTTILNCNLSNSNFKNIQQWGDKYVRKYGHDSQRVKVYDFNTDQLNEIDYSFIKKNLLPDIIKSLCENLSPYVDEILKTSFDSISEYIIDFVNCCDVYYIEYDLLKK